MEMSKGAVADNKASTAKDSIIKVTDLKKGIKIESKCKQDTLKFSKDLAYSNIQLGSGSSGCWGLDREAGILSSSSYAD